MAVKIDPDVPFDDLVSMTEAARLAAPRGTRPLHISTLHRWREGVKVGGRVIKLKTVPWGPRREVTTEAWLREFQAEIADAKAQQREKVEGIRRRLAARRRRRTQEECS